MPLLGLLAAWTWSWKMSVSFRIKLQKLVLKEKKEKNYGTITKCIIMYNLMGILDGENKRRGQNKYLK